MLYTGKKEVHFLRQASEDLKPSKKRWPSYLLTIVHCDTVASMTCVVVIEDYMYINIYTLYIYARSYSNWR